MLAHQRILVTALLMMVVVLVLHTLALTFYFYWQLWWFDIVMHFLGGVVVGLAALWALYGFHAQRGTVGTARQTFLWMMLAIVVVGVGWELFELRFNLYASMHYGSDTTLDLIMDAIGALLAYRVAAPHLLPNALK